MECVSHAAISIRQRRSTTCARHGLLFVLPAARPPEVRPALACDPLGLRAPPLGNALVIAGEQDLGDFQALPLARACILGIFQQPRLETLLVQRGCLADAPRE